MLATSALGKLSRVFSGVVSRVVSRLSKIGVRRLVVPMERSSIRINRCCSPRTTTRRSTGLERDRVRIYAGSLVAGCARNLFRRKAGSLVARCARNSFRWNAGAPSSVSFLLRLVRWIKAFLPPCILSVVFPRAIDLGRGLDGEMNGETKIGEKRSKEEEEKGQNSPRSRDRADPFVFLERILFRCCRA